MVAAIAATAISTPPNRIPQRRDGQEKRGSGSVLEWGVGTNKSEIKSLEVKLAISSDKSILTASARYATPFRISTGATNR